MAFIKSLLTTIGIFAIAILGTWIVDAFGVKGKLFILGIIFIAIFIVMLGVFE